MTAAAGLWWRTAHRQPIVTGVVIVTLDTTRADRLSVYGFMDAGMPSLDRLAREGVVFDEAITVAPLTLPAHCSLFTGLYPPAHGVRDNADGALPPDRTTLAEILHTRGFRTGAFVGSAVLDADRGLAQGFEHYSAADDGRPGDRGRSDAGQRRGNETVDEALRWLDGVGDAPFFLWVHLYDPHRPYDPPEPYRSTSTDPYVAEIAFADAQIGRLLDAIERVRRIDRTVVVVAADHGESLGDHGERDHGVFVYESVLRVPLIVRAPHIPARRVSGVVRLVDVMPTVLDLIGVDAPRMNGRSLVDRMHGKKDAVELDAYSESLYPERFGWSPLRSYRAGRYKFIEAPRPELYDLDRDPFEQRNIYDEKPALARSLEARLAAVDSRAAAPDHAGGGVAPSAEVQQRLGSLGYVASGAPWTSSGRRNLPDPKDCIDVQSIRPLELAGRVVPRCYGLDAGGVEGRGGAMRSR